MEVTADIVERAARVGLGEPSAMLVDWSVASIGGGSTEEVGIVGGISRVTGTLVGQAGTSSWSAIVKVLRHSPAGIGQVTFERDILDGWDYWRREADVYASGLLDDLGDGLVAPRCLHIEDNDGIEIELWLEDLPDQGPPVWSLERYGLAARHLGRFNGSYLVSRSLPMYPWLSRGRTREWLEIGEPGIVAMRDGRRPGLLATWLPDESVNRIQRLWDERFRLLGALEALPRTLCHHDAHRRNLGSRGVGDQEQTTAIDWQGLGVGHLGEDIAPLIAVPPQYLDVPFDQVHALEQTALDGYINGLRDSGWIGDEEDVRLGFLITASLFLGVGGAGLWFGMISADESVATRMIGRPVGEIAAQWSQLHPYYLDLGDEALRLIAQRA
jgi:hypothetical protein